MFAKLKRAMLAMIERSPDAPVAVRADELREDPAKFVAKAFPQAESRTKRVPKNEVKLRDARKVADDRHFQTVCVRVQRWLKHHDIRKVTPPGHIKDKIVMVRQRDPRLYESMVAHAVAYGSAYVEPTT